MEFKKIQKNVYRDLAESFDQLQQRENRNHINKIIKISKFLTIKEGERVLEVGIGTGIHADYLLRLNSVDFLFFGIDYSFEMLQQAKKRLLNKNNTYLSVADGESLAFKDSSFDKIFISGSLHHFSSPETGIKELFRVLKNGGMFCIMEPNYYFPTNYYASYFMREERNIRLMTKKNLECLLIKNDVDFVAENFAYTPPFPKILLPFFDWLDDRLYRCPLLNRFSIMLFVRGIKRG